MRPQTSSLTDQGTPDGCLFSGPTPNDGALKVQGLAHIQTATLDFSGQTPRSKTFGDVYHSVGGAWAQARHVFLAGNGLPQRWRARSRFAILETGFGLGNNFLCTWQAWRDDPQRSETLSFVSIESYPLCAADLRQALAGCEQPDLAQALLAAWPALVPGMHTLLFDEGRVRLTLVLGDIAHAVPQLQGPFDAFYLDGFAPRLNPQMWSAKVMSQWGRLAGPEATAATWSAARPVREGLKAAGFDVHLTPGFGGKREMTVAHRPAARLSRTPAGRRHGADLGWKPSHHRVAVVGAGLAGAWCAHSLAQRGWQVHLYEALTPASGASGNPAGLIHGTLHQEDGRHTRLHRAAALHAQRRLGGFLTSGRVAGDLSGLMSVDRPLEAPRTRDWPYPDYARRAAPQEVLAWCQRGGEATAGDLKPGGWLFPQGGWVSPRQLVGELLKHPRIHLHALPVVRLAHGAEGSTWQVHTADAACNPFDLVVVATGTGLSPLLTRSGLPVPELTPVRGQLSWVSPLQNNEQAPRALTGQGYAAPIPEGGLCFGATAQLNDADPTLRLEDHRFNLRRLQALTGLTLSDDQAWDGRVGWRAQAQDKLPLVGTLPDLVAWQRHSRQDQLRLVPRLEGLYLCGALGSRGLSWAPLAADQITAWVSGEPPLLENDLLDALDPARFWVRQARKAGLAP